MPNYFSHDTATTFAGLLYLLRRNIESEMNSTEGLEKMMKYQCMHTMVRSTRDTLVRLDFFAGGTCNRHYSMSKVLC
jgi:hypothetical protein